MDTTNAWKDFSVSVEAFWTRLSPLFVVAYQILMLAAIVAAGVFAFSWFQQPTLGLQADPQMVLGNFQDDQFDWQAAGPAGSVIQNSLLADVDGQPIRSGQELLSLMSNSRAGQDVRLSLRAPSGHLRAETVTLRLYTNYERVMFYLAPAGIALVFLAAGFFAVRQRLDDPAARALAIAFSSIALVLGAWFDAWSTHRLVVVWLLAAGIAVGALIRYAFLFPSKPKWLSRVPFISWGGYVIGLSASLYAIFTLQLGSNPFAFGRSWQVLLGVGIFSILFLFAGAIYRRHFSPSPVDVEQSRIILWGSGAALLPGVVAAVLNSLPGMAFQIPLVIPQAALVLLALSNAYAVVRYRVVNTDFIISRTLMYALLTVAAGGGYAALISGISVLFSDSVRMNNPFLVGVVVFILALIINPFRNQVQAILDTIFVRGEEVYRQYLDELESDLAQQSSLEEISGLIREFLQQHLEPTRMHIYIYDNLVDRYMPMTGEDGRPTTDIRFPRNSGFVHWLSSVNNTLHLETEQSMPVVLANERSRLALLGTQLFIAMSGQEELTGWLALGPRAAGGRYTGDEIDVLSRLAEIAAAAIERAQVMADKDRRVHEMNVLTRVAQGVNITVEFDDILELLYAQSTQVLPVENFNITLYDKETEILRHAFLVHEDERLDELENEIIPLGYGLERVVLDTRRQLITDDYQQECRNHRLIPNKEGLYAWMGVPLNAGAEVIGVISVGSVNPAILYTEDQYSVLQAIADQAAGAIVKSRLLNETQTRARQLASLNEVTRGLTSTLELDPLLQDIMSSAVEILNCEAGSLLLVDEEKQELVFEVVIGPVADQLMGERQKVGVGLAGKVAEDMTPMIVNNVEQSQDWDSEPDQETGFLTRGMLVVPMHYKGTVIGVLEVINKKNRTPFTDEDQELLSAFAGQAAVAVENVRLYTQTDQELARRVEELSVMQRIDRELNTSLDTERAMQITLEWAMRQSDSEAGLVGVLTDEGLRLMASQGYQEEIAPYRDTVLPLEMKALSSVLREGNYYERSGGDLAGESFLAGAGSQAAVPIQREAEVIGVLLLESLEPERYGPSTGDFLSRLCDHASIAISNAQLYSEVQRANLAKSEFVSFVSHELKTPMTSIRGYADLLSAGSVGPVNEAQNEFLTTIRFNIQRMATLVSDLADISRIEAGRLHLDFAPITLTEVVHEVVRSTKALADEKSHQIEIDAPEDLPNVWGDRNRLAQIMTNLMSNAIKYTLEGGKITIRASQQENQWDEAGPDQVVHIEVIDSGIGIKPEDQAKIFQQYFRTDEGKDTASGTGLGLNITRYLVEMQGGKIWFESEYGTGTTFHFTVPLAEGE